jgi:hypothetical protein
MLMINRAIASVFFLFVASIYRQDNPLERPASDFDSKGVGLTETLLKFAHQQHFQSQSTTLTEHRWTSPSTST